MYNKNIKTSDGLTMFFDDARVAAHKMISLKKELENLVLKYNVLGVKSNRFMIFDTTQDKFAQLTEEFIKVCANYKVQCEEKKKLLLRKRA